MFKISVNYCVYLDKAAELKEQTGNIQRNQRDQEVNSSMITINILDDLM